MAFGYFIVQEVPDFTAQFIAKDITESKPLKGLRVGVIRETLDEGVDVDVVTSIRSAISHLEELGCTATEVIHSLFAFSFLYHMLANFFFTLYKNFFSARIFTNKAVLSGVFTIILVGVTGLLHPRFI